ncbi:MAG: glycosyltransferase [Actinomycetota bacterium]|nr:glycosyltransferase [Actinomycetota bacterium]
MRAGLRTIGTISLGAGVAASIRAIANRRVRLRGLRTDQRHRIDRPPAPGAARLSVVIPAYSEAGRIAGTIAALRAALAPIDRDGGVEIVVVDDGSTDGTSDAARAGGADQVVPLRPNRGKGAAVRAGMLATHGRTVVFTDADLSYAPEQILRLLAEVEGGWDVVVGSRKHIETNVLVRGRCLRELSGRAFNLLTFGVLLGQYRDTQCGLKAFRSDVAQLLFSNARIDGFAFDVEIFHLIERYRLSLLEVPVQLVNSKTSTVRVGVEGVRMLRDLFRVRRWGSEGVYDLKEESGAVPPLRSSAR